jgi:uncharacterized membrane protein
MAEIKDEFEKIDGIKVPKTQKLERESPSRTLAKTISWRIIASLTTFGLAMLFFNDDPEAAKKATGIAVSESIIKMFLYFFHERAWANVNWGRYWIKNKMVRRIKLYYIRKRRSRL